MQQQFVEIEQAYKVFCLFGGFGGGAYGAQQSEAGYRGLKGRAVILGSVDSDPDACADFEMWTGVKSTQADLFDAEQYRDWWGKEPPADWREVGAEEIRAAAQGEDPDVVIITAPCKGFSGLLSEDKSKSSRYQALNKLTFRGVFLTLEAWKHNLPRFILFENVPRIATRGKKFLSQIKKLLAAYGYVFHDTQHDCGELGGLAQHRKRFLLVARHPAKVTSYLYHPPKERVRAIGEVLGEMPMPDDPEAGPMHRLPRLQWKTWMRLAMIPPGGDWRDLQDAAGKYKLELHPDRHHMKWRVVPWDQPGPTVIGQTDVQAGAPIVADVRTDLLQPYMREGETHPNKYQVLRFDQPGPTVTGSRLGSGAPAVAQPLNHTPMGKTKGAYHVQDWEKPSNTVIADPGHRKSGGGGTVADPRITHAPRDASMRVGDWDKPSGPVIGNASVTSSNGIGAVADPRLSETPRFNNVQRVLDFTEPAGAVTGASGTSNAAPVVADPRYTREPRAGVLSVQSFDEPSSTVTGGKDPNGNMLSVTDPRREYYGNMLRVTPWEEPSNTVTGAAGPNQAANLVADPRLECAPRSGTMGVLDWEQPAPSVIGASDVHNGGAAAVADPRIPEDGERGVWLIVSPWNCWHRPLTTLELLALQGFPWKQADGSPIMLAGRSDRSWRERIGNAVPPPTMRAIMDQMIYSMLASETQDWRMDVLQSGVWVQPEEEREAPVVQ